MTTDTDPKAVAPGTLLDDRQDAGTAGDEAARRRDERATDRDLAATERDRIAGLRDEKSGGSSLDAAAQPAARDRTRAAEDRGVAARDRDRAARDRDRSARDRVEAAEDLQAVTLDERTRTGRRDPGLDEPSADREPAEPTTVSDDRRDAATAGDKAAGLRDAQAADRDLVATERDLVARLRDEKSRGNGLKAGSEPAAEDRDSAAHDRGDAARDRDRAASDRGRAARDREEAAQDVQALTFDELTRTRRRGPGLDEFQREIDRALRTRQQLAVAYVDVDGLKAINDTKGHAAGDELLKKVTGAMRSDMRSYDSIIRLGGDEFLCVLPGLGIDAARSALDHVRDWLVESTGDGSISVGFAQLEPTDSCEGLIGRADQDLIASRA